MLQELHFDDEERETGETHHANSPSLVQDYLPFTLGCTQESLSCSVVISAHSRQTSQVSDHSHCFMSSLLDSSPSKASEDKENLSSTGKLTHRSTASVIVNAAVDQSYSNLLRVLRPRASEAPSQDLISDCLSIIGSDFRTPVDSSLIDPVIVRTAVSRSPTEAQTSTIVSNLSSDSAGTLATPCGKYDANTVFTSPYGATTTDSNLLEIDLYESRSSERQSKSPEPTNRVLGALPVRAYCPSCCTDVSTSVSFELPRLPL